MGPGIFEPLRELGIRQNRKSRFCHEVEVFRGADRWSFEAGRGWSAGGRVDPQGGISEQTFYRWKKQHIGREVDQLRQMKQLQEENTRLKQLVAELSLDKTMLQDVLRKKF
jgi:hypothetical protein